MVSPTKLPPQNIEAEQSLLGALLIDKDSIVRISEILHPSNFYRTEQHGPIFEAVQSLFEKREPIDLVTVTEELKRKGISRPNTLYSIYQTIRNNQPAKNKIKKQEVEKLLSLLKHETQKKS